MVSDDADAYYGRGNAKNKIKDYDGAMADYGMAIRINPKSAEAYYNRGLAKIKAKDKICGCLDLNKSKELGLKQANKEVKKHCN